MLKISITPGLGFSRLDKYKDYPRDGGSIFKHVRVVHLFHSKQSKQFTSMDQLYYKLKIKLDRY